MYSLSTYKLHTVRFLRAVAGNFITFFCFGIVFANFNTLAVAPLGHIAGVASSVISSVQTLISVALGASIGRFYNGTVLPLVLGFLVLGMGSFLITIHTHKRAKFSPVIG